MTRCILSLLIVAASPFFIDIFGNGFAASKEDVSTSCVAPARGPNLAIAGESAVTQAQVPAAAAQPLAKVGKPAPDFEANAFTKDGFKNVKLSDFKGKWVALCFYPGDFTFV